MQQSRGVFISYRRIDSQSIAGRLGDDLKRGFGDEAVFRDIDDIAPGKDFVEALDTALAACGVLLAVIGPAWLEQLERRAATGDSSTIDHVRREIETALSRHIDVIAVLVDGASFPGVLPQSLQAMGRLQPHEQRDRSWRSDTAALLKLLEPRIDRVAADPFHRDPRLLQWLRKLSAAALRPRTLAIAGAAAAVGVVALGVSWWIEQREQQGSDVAFVLPPDSQGADTDDELRVHRDLRAVLKRALDLPHVEIVPDSLAAAEIDHYRLEAKDALLDFEGRRGLPRVFIHTRYSVDTSTGTWRMLATPYLRPLPGQAWKRVEGWNGLAYDGEAPRRVAVKVGFELIEFLAARGLLRLQPGEIEQARAALLEEYRGLIETQPCDALRELLVELRDPQRAQPIAADLASMRRVLHSRCTRDGAGSPAAADRSASTAATVLGGALGL